MERMDIYSKEGQRVMVTKSTATSGWDIDKENVKKLLVLYKEYTVEETIVSKSSSIVFLKEFPEKSFNTVNFINIE